MNRESLHKLMVALVIIVAGSSTVNVFRWITKMATGMATGIAANAAFVLRTLEAILLVYVAYHTFMSRDDMEWQNTVEGQLNRKIFLVAMMIALVAIVAEQFALV